MTSRRRPLSPSRSLKRRTTPREPEPIRPEDYATTANPIGACRVCHHHTSAWIGGACTAMVPDVERLLVYCGCDCREHLTEEDSRG